MLATAFTCDFLWSGFVFFFVSLVHVSVYNHQKPQCPSTDTLVHFIPALFLLSAHTELILRTLILTCLMCSILSKECFGLIIRQNGILAQQVARSDDTDPPPKG